MAEFNTKLHQV